MTIRPNVTTIGPATTDLPPQKIDNQNTHKRNKDHHEEVPAFRSAHSSGGAGNRLRSSQ